MKTSFKNLIIGLAGLVFVGVLFVPKKIVDNFDQLFEVVFPDKPVVPISLSIESIGVDASIQPVGLLDGAMAVPTFATDVGWYKMGVRPGEVGSSVLAGHVNWLRGQDAVFTNLNKVEIGDIVKVSDNYGSDSFFIVREIKSYPADGDTKDVFSSDDGIAHLNLITCSGLWNIESGTHDSRLVVFTDKI